MSYGIIYMQGATMMLRRLNEQFNFGNGAAVKDALPEATAELTTPATMGMVWIKEPGELFLLGTVEMEPGGAGAPTAVYQLLAAAEVDPMLRQHLIQFLAGWHEALCPSVPTPIWDK